MPHAAIDEQMRDNWESSFREQIASQAYNAAPAEALVRNVAYWLREARPDGNYAGLRFLEAGCGAGPNLLHLAAKGIRVSGVDISPTALDLCRENFRRAGMERLLEAAVESSVERLPFPDGSFDGVLESCVFQHLPRDVRQQAFAEVARVLRPGGVFCGYMLSDSHSVYRLKRDRELAEDPGTLMLQEGGSRFYLTDTGLSHFFRRDEYRGLLPGFATVDPCLVEYDLPEFEAKKRGYAEYRQGMWALFAVK